MRVDLQHKQLARAVGEAMRRYHAMGLAVTQEMDAEMFARQVEAQREVRAAYKAMLARETAVREAHAAVWQRLTRREHDRLVEQALTNLQRGVTTLDTPISWESVEAEMNAKSRPLSS